MNKAICKECGFENTSVSKYCKDCGYELQKIEIPEVARVPENTKKANNNSKKILGLAIGAIATVLIFYSVNHFIFNPSIDKSMMAVASELNKSCPMMVDSETQLDNAIALPNSVFQYNYTLVNIEKSQTDTLMLKTYLEPIILNQSFYFHFLKENCPDMLTKTIFFHSLIVKTKLFD